MIDGETDRYNFVSNPVKLKIKNFPDVQEVEVPLHPDKPTTKKIKVKEVYISGEDFERMKGKEFRLLHLFNVKLSKNGDAEFTSLENKNVPRIQWVSIGEKAKILMENGLWVSGLAESLTRKLKTGEVIQFERFGFVRLDKKKKDVLEFWFGHK